MYCTLADLVATYGEPEMVLLTDRTYKPPVLIDEVVVDRAIADAAGEIDMHLHARYQLPLASVPPVLTRIACTLVYAGLHTRVKADHPALTAAEQQRKLLRGIARGELSLGIDSGGAPAPVNDVAQISPGRNDWGDTW